MSNIENMENGERFGPHTIKTEKGGRLDDFSQVPQGGYAEIYTGIDENGEETVYKATSELYTTELAKEELRVHEIFYDLVPENVVKVKGFDEFEIKKPDGSSEKKYAVATERMDTKNMLSNISSENIMPQDLVNIVRGVGKVIDVGAENGLMHDDLALDNIVYVEGLTKVWDFSNAKNIGVSKRPSSVVGKPTKVAPEKLLRQPTTEKSDQIALAQVAFEAFTGVDLFILNEQTRKDWDAIEKKRKSDYSDEDELNDLTFFTMKRKVMSNGLPKDFDAVGLSGEIGRVSKIDILARAAIEKGIPEDKISDFLNAFDKALKKNPDERFNSCADFANALEQAIS